MTTRTSRRGFLGMCAVGLVAAVVPDAVRSTSAGTITAPGDEISNSNPEISVWVTSGDERFVTAPRSTWRPAAGAPTTDQLRLNPAVKFQEILGFGGAFTDAACYTFNRLSPLEREKLFHELFHPTEMALNVGPSASGRATTRPSSTVSMRVSPIRI